MKATSITSILWFVAAAAGAALLDIGQVSLATGGAPIHRLAAMVLTLYVAAGGLVGSLATPTLRVLGVGGSRTGASLLALAFVGSTLAVALPYINIVHLPGITEPITLLSNTAILLAATAIWLGLSHVALVGRLAASAPAAAAVLLLFVGGTALVATGRIHREESVVEASIAAGPDVYIVVIDTLRHDRTGPRSATPQLSLLAARGTRFERAYAQASWTKPSVASLFTSLYPSTHGANLRRDRLGTGVPTLPELLAERGYRTAVFSANPWISPAFGFDRGVQFFHESETEAFARLVMLFRGIKTADKLLPGRPLTSGLRSMEDLYGLRGARSTNCERDVELIEQFASWLSGAGDRSVFAYLHLMSPHIPYDPPGREHDFSATDQVALLQAVEALPETRRRLLVELYDETVRHVDELLGRLIDVIENTGRANEAVIVVTADHGEEFHEHGRWGHGKSLYDEVTRIPLVLVGPGIGAARTSGAPAMLVDILPTVAGIVGLEPDAGWEGRDLRNLPPDGTAYSELIREGGFESFMLYRDGEKYLESTAGVGQPVRAESYDLNVDPGEQTDLAATAETTDTDRWSAELSRMRSRAGERSLPKNESEIDYDARRRLEALGYIN